MKICRPSGPFCRILVLVGEAEPGRCEKIGTFLLNTLFDERTLIRAMVRHDSF